MRVSEAVTSRRSMRVFKSDPVPKADIEWIIETANRAASNGNLQPWKLYVTTGKPEYKQFIASSPHHKRFRSEAGGHVSSMNWASTDALGQISLAVVPSSLSAAVSSAQCSRGWLTPSTEVSTVNR